MSPAGKRLMDSTSTCIRPISEFNLDFGLEKSAQMTPETFGYSASAGSPGAAYHRFTA